MWEGHKIWKNLPPFFELIISKVKQIGRFFQIFVAFSEYLNFSAISGFYWRTRRSYNPRAGIVNFCANQTLSIPSRSSLLGLRSWSQPSHTRTSKIDFSNQGNTLFQTFKNDSVTNLCLNQVFQIPTFLIQNKSHI